jgi:peptide deformylase
MAILEILTYPDKRLSAPAKPVEVVDDRLRRLIDDMTETMYAADGVGLAATQVGVESRVIVIDTSAVEEKGALVRAINPVIVASSGRSAREEGCLSVPEVREEVSRPSEVTVRFLDQDGRPVEMACDGLLARVFQHEIDHLEGKLFIDHLSALKRGLIKRRLSKAKSKAGREAGDL